MPFTLNSPKETALELQWMASAPEYRGSFSTYIWQPHTEPPKSKGARFYISKVVEQRARDVLVLLDSWDLAKGSIEKYRLDRSELGSFKTSDTSSSTATEVHLLIYAAFKSLIEDTTSFIDGSFDQLAELVSPCFSRRSGLITYLIFALRNTQDGRVHPVDNFISCYILMTAVTYPHPD